MWEASSLREEVEVPVRTVDGDMAAELPAVAPRLRVARRPGNVDVALEAETAAVQHRQVAVGRAVGAVALQAGVADAARFHGFVLEDEGAAEVLVALEAGLRDSPPLQHP